MTQRFDSLHEAVLRQEAIDYLRPRPGGRYIDGTIGAGGHTKALFQQAADIQVLGIDRDQEALEASRQRLKEVGSQLHLVRGSFSQLDQHMADLGWQGVDGILLDVGVSSMQLDRPERGFSYRAAGPLDMRMDRRQKTTASMILSTGSEAELCRIFREYGEEPRARQVARAVIRRREESPLELTSEFAELVRKVAGRPGSRRHQAEARCFQALRIAVNGELDELKTGLHAALDALIPGGRLVVISFHSLEDRIVKKFFVHAAATCTCPPGMPVCRCGKQASLRILTRKPITADTAELERNPRSSSAKLRAAEKCA